MSENFLEPEERGQVLLVDDTPDNLRLLAQILTQHGYRVRAATSGQRALESVRLVPPDLVLLDIKMPGMDGFEVCRELKSDPATRDIPVLFISALGDVTDKVRAFTLGGVDYICKPFQCEEVVARVGMHLTLRRLQKQLEEANRRMSRELVLAGEVQKSFLPNKLPELPGWQQAVTLLPARQTSGDFYDTFIFPDGRLGVLVADVVDKGVWAALFMSLTYALFRTHALENAEEPREVFKAVNSHILHDTHANQFVTAFYGVLDPATGRLAYSNAGHCPPLLLGAEAREAPRWLYHTGMPLGVLEGNAWEQHEVQLRRRDLLVLYTDGVIEAENEAGAQWGRERLVASARQYVGSSAEQVREGLLRDVQAWVGEGSLSDDLVLFIVTTRAGN